MALALSGAEEAGAQTELVDLRDYRVIFDGKRLKEVGRVWDHCRSATAIRGQ